MKIFGREPTAVLQAISILLSVVVTFGVPDKYLSADTQVLLVAFISAGFGLWNAVATRPWTPAAFVGFASAGAALLTGYGLELRPELVAAITTAIPVLLTLQTRSQVTPVADPAPREFAV